MLRRFHGWVRAVSGFGHVVTTKSGIRLNLPTLLNVVLVAREEDRGMTRRNFPPNIRG